MNLVLIGHRCAGKTTVGKRVADRLRRRFVDTDDLLQQRYGPIRTIVETGGWPYFRLLEKRIIKEISNQDDLVIAPGGGFVLDPDNVTALKKKGFLIWLKAEPQVLYARMMNDPRTLAQRPSLTGKGMMEETEELIATRAPLYGRAAEVQLDTSTLDVETVMQRVLSIFKEKERRN
ncbi:MAG: shikimate kinase [candidate division WOR-3 bacterium]